MRKRKPKDGSMRTHTKRRVLERFGFWLTDAEYDSMINDIESRREDCIRRQSVSRRWFICNLRGKDVVAIYNPLKKQIHTVLDTEVLHGGQDETVQHGEIY